jgi:nucleoid DNA-binding protein
MAKKPSTKKAPTKSQIFKSIAETTQLTRKQVAAVLEALDGEVKKSLKSAGVFTIPNLCKIVVRMRPATKAREGRNPATGETIMIPAKPASKTVRVRALKPLKEVIK